MTTPPPGAPPPSPAAQEPPEQQDRQAQPVDAEQQPRLPFPVVGIGGSAGGLEAFSAFFEAMAPDSGMAFVLVQHLPPERESMLADILARRTRMPVLPIDDGMAVEPNHVYVIRPNHTLTLRDGRLRLGAPTAARGHSRPVDDFFRSLAEEQRERAIAVVMSGMGSNGSAGAQMVKAVGGLCIAQEPQSAHFPSMPKHLIDLGLADLVLAPAEMPAAILRYVAHPLATVRQKGDRGEDDGESLTDILNTLRDRISQDFSRYKRPTVLRRVQRRMGVAQVTRLSQYAQLLRRSPAEAQSLADDLLIHVTGFFRDPEAWDALREKVVDPLVAERDNGSELRCWVTACSSGEEAYSLAILLVEALEAAGKQMDVKVFATDLAQRSLGFARAGIYAGGIESEVSPERLARFFEKDDGMYRVRHELRERVVFAPQNVLQDPPFSRLDILSCRNLLIYLEPEAQARVLGFFHFGLREQGTLFLGTSETLGAAEEMFEPIDKRWRIFRRVGASRRRAPDFSFPRSIVEAVEQGVARPARSSIAQLTQQALLERFSPPSVTIDRDHNVVYFHGDTERFLTLPRGEPTRELLAMARESVRGAVRTALHAAMAQKMEVTMRDGTIDTDQGPRRVWVTVTPLSRNATGMMLVSFEIRPEPPSSDALLDGGPADAGALRDELARTREELQATIAQLQASNEDQKAANEEVTSINEELQSTNEELETSKEELQSLNEELVTVNAQLNAKIEEHEATTNDLTSLLSSTDIAVVFLDLNFRIRRYTPAVRALFDVIPSDAGRPLRDLAPRFDDPTLLADAEEVLARLVPHEREIRTHAGRWFMRRILAYRTSDNRIDGVVITFVETTGRKQAEQALAETARLLDLSNDAIVVYDPRGRITYWNHGASELYGWSRDEALGRDLFELLLPEVGMTAEQLMAELGRQGRLTREVEQRTRDGRRVRVLCRWALDREAGDGGAILVTATDITRRSQAEEELRQREEQHRLIVEGAQDFAMLNLDASGRITSWNRGAEHLTGFSETEAVGQSGAIIFTAEDRLARAPEREQETAQREGRSIDERWHARKDGSRFWGTGVMTAHRKQGSGEVVFVKVLRDETARKRAEDAMQEAVARAETANRMKDEFLATVSHELRTPLAAILMWSRLLRDKMLTPERAEQAIEGIASSAEAQNQLVDDLLDSSRITSGKLKLELGPLDVEPLVRAAVEAIAPTAQAKSIDVSVGIAPDTGSVMGDPDRLRQVLWNLLSNAVKFTGEGGRVRVEAERAGSRLELRVIDSGEGIDPAFLPHVFEPFRQADGATTRVHTGLGLGLAICERLVELHGGSIEARSEGRGKGATFVVKLPSLAAKRTPRPAPPAPVLERAPDGALEGVSVLLVEDADETREAIEALLDRTGAHVRAVSSAAEAFEAFEAKRPDLVVSDIGMAGEDGYSLMRRLRALEAEKPDGPPAKAIALTSFARPEDRDKAHDAGFDRHVAKPVEPGRLVGEILVALGRVG